MSLNTLIVNLIIIFGFFAFPFTGLIAGFVLWELVYKVIGGLR